MLTRSGERENVAVSNERRRDEGNGRREEESYTTIRTTTTRTPRITNRRANGGRNSGCLTNTGEILLQSVCLGFCEISHQEATSKWR